MLSLTAGEGAEVAAKGGPGLHVALESPNVEPLLVEDGPCAPCLRMGLLLWQMLRGMCTATLATGAEQEQNHLCGPTLR